MKRVRALMVAGSALTIVSAVVIAAPANTVESGAYREVLLPGTTIVTGYPNQNDFYVVSETEKPKLLAELAFHRQTDEAIALADAHAKTHQYIQFKPEVMLALNDKISQIKQHYDLPLKKVTLDPKEEQILSSREARLEFNAYPNNQVTPVTSEEKQAARTFAARVANKLTHSKFPVFKLENQINAIEQMAVVNKPIKANSVVMAKASAIQIGNKQIVKSAQSGKKRVAQIKPHVIKQSKKRVKLKTVHQQSAKSGTSSLDALTVPHAFVPSKTISRKQHIGHQKLKAKTHKPLRAAKTKYKTKMVSKKVASKKFVVKEVQFNKKHELILVVKSQHPNNELTS